MRIREHFLLGTEIATISATAKSDCQRQALFEHAVTAILARYQEEFGAEAIQSFVQKLSTDALPDMTWRLRTEDSCWSQADAMVSGKPEQARDK